MGVYAKLDRWALLLDGRGMEVLAAFTPALVFFFWGTSDEWGMRMRMTASVLVWDLMRL